jgi:hypothetical protein
MSRLKCTMIQYVTVSFGLQAQERPRWSQCALCGHLKRMGAYAHSDKACNHKRDDRHPTWPVPDCRRCAGAPWTLPALSSSVRHPCSSCSCQLTAASSVRMVPRAHRSRSIAPQPGKIALALSCALIMSGASPVCEVVLPVDSGLDRVQLHTVLSVGPDRELCKAHNSTLERSRIYTASCIGFEMSSVRLSADCSPLFSCQWLG